MGAWVAGSTNSPAETYTGILEVPRRPTDGLQLINGVTTQDGTGARGTIGPSGGTDYTGIGGSQSTADVRLESSTDPFPDGITNWGQHAQCRVLSRGPHLYEPTAEFAATPTALGWTWPGSGVMHLDHDRCLAAGSGAFADYTAWASAGGSTAYTAYLDRHYQPLTSGPITLRERGFANGNPTFPSWATTWVLGFPTSYVIGADIGTPSQPTLCLDSLGATLSGATTMTSHVTSGSTTIDHSQDMADWPTLDVTDWGEVYAWGFRLSGSPVSSTDMLAYSPTYFYTVFVDLTFPTVTATATKTPWQWLSWEEVSAPLVGVLKTKVSMSGATEEDRWQSWGFDNETAGAGKVLASDGWHVADDDAATVTGALKVKDHDGVWQHVSWMTGA